ncbi:hypothetical protein, partial [Klebsiella pneumoniae]|uniref:hypothetical protein n=1 Tax=Klebsiella pneumoniae TaxID=573 RepID=UPI003EDFF2C3
MRTPFESLVRALAHKQLHANAAEAILGRLLARFTKNDFPTPHQLLELSELEYREFGFSTAKAKSLIDIATKTIEGIVP